MKASTLRQVRQVHNYLAVFFAPAILFFAFTGGLQTTGLFEARDSATPRWIAAITSLHKHQLVAGPRKRPPAATAGGAGLPAGPPAGPRPRDGREPERFVPLRPFVLLLSLALFVTTALGLVIALATRATRRLSVVLAAAGVVVPLLLML